MTPADRVYKLETDVARAEASKRELTMLDEAFEKYRASVVEAWANTDPRDEKGREKLWVATTILSQVERTLRNVIETGKVSQRELDAIRKAGEAKPLLHRLKPGVMRYYA